MLASIIKEFQLGHTKLRLSSVDSTNNYAANMLNQGLLSHGTVILADEQTNGRGQRGSVWQSEPGLNIQMTVVLINKNMAVQEQRFLNCFVCIALVKFIESFGLKAEIKWPNDILVGNRKIAGILIENQLKDGLIASTLIGIGMNVNQEKFDLLTATSLSKEMKSSFSITEVCDSLLHHLNSYCLKFSLRQFTELQTHYFENLWGYQKLKRFEDKNGIFNGTIIGITEEGFLQVQTKDGEIKYDIKEIRFLLEEENL